MQTSDYVCLFCKQRIIDAVRNGWYQDSPYKTDFTDGTDEDPETMKCSLCERQ